MLDVGYHEPFIDLLSELHLFEQVVTSSQLLSHFFLQVKGRPQTMQTFPGRLDLLGFFSFFPLLLPFPLPLPNNLVVCIITLCD